MIMDPSSSATPAVRRRNSEPVSLFKRMRTLRKQGWSIKGTKKMKRTNSEPGWAARRPSWDLFSRKRSPSEPELYPGATAHNKDDVIMNMYKLFYGDHDYSHLGACPSNGTQKSKDFESSMALDVHRGDNIGDGVNAVVTKGETIDAMMTPKGRQPQALKRKPTPRYPHQFSPYLHEKLHGKMNCIRESEFTQISLARAVAGVMGSTCPLCLFKTVSTKMIAAT